MKHNIRINGEVKEIDCELGSGILDKNGREIFEGNKLQVSFAGWVWFDKVHFQRGAFYVGKRLLKDFLSHQIEIVD